MKMNMKNIIKSTLAATALSATALSHSVTLGDFDGTTVKLGGYVKLDAMFTDYSDGDLAAGSWLRDFYLPSKTPTGGESQNMDFDMHVRQTRFNLGTSTKVDDHTLSTFIEMDFQTHSDGAENVSNSYSPRIRHAFIKYDNWLLGQTWSTFQNLGALPETADFIGNTEFGIFVRQTQVRYTNGPWQFAIENPETTVQGVGVTDDNEMPDFVGRYNLKSGDLTFTAAVLARQLTYNDGADIDSSTTSVGVSLSGKYMVGKDDVKFGINTGSGMGRYIGLNIASGASVVDNKLDAIDSTAFYVGYRHFWNEKLRSSVTYSAIEIDGDISANKSASSMRFNLFYSPVAKLTFGGEIAMGTLEKQPVVTVDGDGNDVVTSVDGDMTRFQFIAKLAF